MIELEWFMLGFGAGILFPEILIWYREIKRMIREW